MKFRIHDVLSSLLLISGFMLVSTWALALTSDSQKTIHIDSEQQAVDMVSNIMTLTGDVVIKRGSVDIRADKVVITRPGGQDGKEVVEGYGKPVTFYQLQDDGQPVQGYANKVRYETNNDLVILTGNAYLERVDSNVKGDRITYLVKQQQMEAFSEKGKRVTTMLVAAQLQDKSSAKLPVKPFK